MTANREAVRDWAIALRAICGSDGGPDQVRVRWGDVTLLVDGDRARLIVADCPPVDLLLDEERFAVAPHVL